MVRLLEGLAAARIGDTFNQYRETGGDDVSREAPAIRRQNLLRYLAQRQRAPVLVAAEAAGWRGARYSGLCLLSERQFAASPEDPDGYQRSSNHPRGWAEPSAAVVQGVLREGGWNGRVLLFNVVPSHPAGPTPHSNRRPTHAEAVEGSRFLFALLDIVRPRHVAAIGRVAAGVLGEVPVIRHPSHGGAARCRTGLRELLSVWLPPTDPAPGDASRSTSRQPESAIPSRGVVRQASGPE